MQNMLKRGTWVAILVTAAGCGEILDSRPAPPLRLAVSVAPDRIMTTDRFEVTVRIENPSGRPRTFKHSCLYFLDVQGPIPVRTDPLVGCWAIATRVTIPPEGTEWRMSFRLLPTEHPAVVPGEYTVMARAMGERLDDGTATASLRVD